ALLLVVVEERHARTHDIRRLIGGDDLHRPQLGNEIRRCGDGNVVGTKSHLLLPHETFGNSEGLSVTGHAPPRRPTESPRPSRCSVPGPVCRAASTRTTCRFSCPTSRRPSCR